MNETDKDDELYINKTEELFQYRQRFGSRKKISLQTLSNLQVEILAEDFDGKRNVFAIHNITNIEEVKSNEFYNATY